jgi:hypothetical protein
MVNITANKVGMLNHDIKPVSVVVPNKDKIKVGKLLKFTNGNKKVMEIIALHLMDSYCVFQLLLSI